MKEPTDQPPVYRSWAIPIGTGTMFALLYLLTLGMGLFRLQGRPSSAYNWEAYTLRGLLAFVQHPSDVVLKINEGLMTNSGESAVVVGPAWLAFTMFGDSIASLRLATLIIAALAVPLTWLLGRALWSDSVGLCAAVIVATSQVFLLYARTGTNVGMSIAPAILGYLILWKVTSPDTRRWWLWLGVLQLSIVGNSYFYSPIRFLWPIAIALLLTELVLRSGSRRRFLISLAVTCATLPAALLLLMDLPSSSPVHAVKAYYNGRGEQIFRINDSPDKLVEFIPVDDEAERAELETQSTNALAARFIWSHAQDLGDLLLDRNTNPAITDYWNPSGRLYSRPVVPLFLLSMLILLRTFFKSPRSRFVLALFWGYSLPLLLTSNVHIGRLVFVVPLLALLVALPIESIARWLGRLPGLRGRVAFQRWAPVGLAIAVAVLAGVPSLRDWASTPFPREQIERTAEQIDSALREDPTRQLAYVFGDVSAWEIESLRASVLRMELQGAVRFVDLVTGETVDSGPIPILYHGLTTMLEDPSSVPGYCTNLYVVEPNVAERFAELTTTRAVDICGGPLNTLMLGG